MTKLIRMSDTWCKAVKETALTYDSSIRMSDTWCKAVKETALT